MVLAAAVAIVVWALRQPSSVAQANRGSTHHWRYVVVTSAAIGKKIMWAYPGGKKIEDDTKVADALNVVGQDGWELVTMDKQNSASMGLTMYYFKQPE